MRGAAARDGWRGAALGLGEKHHQRFRRTENLVEIGAASREELEQVTAEYKTEQARLNAARQKLLLLGMSAKQVDDLHDSGQMGALISVEAPACSTMPVRSRGAAPMSILSATSALRSRG